jgi:hypothetical protein
MSPIRNHAHWLWLATVAAAGCAGGSDPAGNASLGIVRFQSTQSPSELQIIGRAADGRVIGMADLQVGPVSIPEEGLSGEGRALIVDVKGLRAEHTSVGNVPVVLPLFHGEGSEISNFLEDPHVAPLLAAWGVTFSTDNPPAPQSGGETRYLACTYGFAGTCGETGCCQYSASGSTYEDVCCGTAKKLYNRSCSSYPGTSACGTNGPNGCAVCWSESFSTSCGTQNCGVSGCGYLIDSGVDQGLQQCTPNCTGKSCGAGDGCGGKCFGTCTAGLDCVDLGPTTCGETYHCQ